MLDTSIARPWLALAFLVWTLLAAIAGWQTGREQEQDRCTAQVATLKADQATQERQAAQAALDRLQQAQARGDALQARLAAEETNRQTQAQEDAREIKRLTTGRPCLNAGTVRLLNEPAIGLRTPVLPAPAAGLLRRVPLLPAIPTSLAGSTTPDASTTPAEAGSTR